MSDGRTASLREREIVATIIEKRRQRAWAKAALRGDYGPEQQEAQRQARATSADR